jgi:hypothetical protein
LFNSEDSTLKDLNAFKAFNSAFRETYVEVKDRRPVILKRDRAGKGGVIGFTTSWVFERKKDKKQVEEDTMYVNDHGLKV